MRTKKIFANIVLILISVCITLAVSEVIYRKLIFSNENHFKFLKEPKQYANQEWDANYWKLAQIWGLIRPPYPDTLLGWEYELQPKSFLHHDAENLMGRRPVLIYGDSFANCIDSTNCFEDYLNNDTVFSKTNFIINYGMGGFGVDQIYTLMKNSFRLYEKPYIIFSFLTFDLDRSGLSIREGQKPFYTLDTSGELILNTSNYNPDAAEYLKQNPPEIKSYLWKKFLYSKLNILPGVIKRYLQGETAQNVFLKKLNRKLIHESVKVLRENKIDFIFLIFEGYNDFTTPKETKWRTDLIREISHKKM
jgi:hypothetical protein